MNKQQLINELDKLGVPRSIYSLTGELNSDTIVMYENYGSYEVFYLDERGGRNDFKVFNSENDAFEHIYNIFKRSHDVKIKFGLKHW